MSQQPNKRLKMDVVGNGSSTKDTPPSGSLPTSPNAPRYDESRQHATSTNVEAGSIMCVEAQKFSEVVLFDAFVDRTLLLKELLKRSPVPSYVQIYAPTKFGKTINLSMVKLFLDIECDAISGKSKRDVTRTPTKEELDASDNMAVFRRYQKDSSKWCKILKEEQLVEDHFGRHPVVTLNFKNASCETKADATLMCATQVRAAYLNHKYLANSKQLAYDDAELKLLRDRCQKWCSYTDESIENLSVFAVTEGLENLIKSLKKHWNRNPVLLVDEIDKPVVEALEMRHDEDAIRAIGEAVTDVIFACVKTGDDNLKLELALITGISKVTGAGLSPLDNTTNVYFLSDPRFSPYYGLTSDEISNLVHALFESEGEAEILKIIECIKQYYNGYYQVANVANSSESIEHARYCLYSVLKYISLRRHNKSNSEFNFWEEGGLVNCLVPMMKNSEPIIRAIHALMFDDSHKSIPIVYNKSINAPKLLTVFKKGKTADVNTMFNFFLHRGLLSIDETKGFRRENYQTMVNVRIPNLEVRGLFKGMFSEYESTLRDNVSSSFVKCGAFLRDLPDRLAQLDSADMKEDLIEFCGGLQVIFKGLHCISEAMVNSYLLCLGKLYANYEECSSEFRVPDYDISNQKISNVFIDVWMQQGDFAILWEIKHGDGKAHSSLAAAEDIVKLLPGKTKAERSGGKSGTGADVVALRRKEIKTFLLVGLAVEKNGSVHMLMFPNSHEWSKVIQVNPEDHVKAIIKSHLQPAQ